MSLDALRALAESMPIIEQAKGIVMVCYDCDASAAFTALSRLSSSKNIKLRDLAGLVVKAVSGQGSTAELRTATAGERVRRILQGDGAQGAERGHRR